MMQPSAISGLTDMKENIEAAIKMLRGQGHSVCAQVREGKQWFHVDERMLVSWAEMNDLARGVFSLVELEDLYRRRRAETGLR
jgi:hypothetical protein